MRILIYLHHPAQFYLFKNVIFNLKAKGHHVQVVATKKDVLEDLLQNAGIEYKNFLPHGRKDNKFSMAMGLLKQDFKLFAECLAHRPDLMIGTSAEICHVGFVLRIPSILVNEDDADVVPLLGKIAHPFANYLLAPDVCNTGNPGKTIHYKGYHELSYLHPSVFTPDKTIAKKYLNPDEPYFILRFAKLTAHHDTGIKGIDNIMAMRLIKHMQPYGKVYITSERKLSTELEPFRLNINPLDMHHILAFSELFIGDSQTMSAESGVLGIPFIRFNGFVGRIGYLRDLEDNYQLGYGIRPDNEDLLYTTLETLLNNKNKKVEWEVKRKKMLSEKINVSEFITRLIENYPGSVTPVTP